MTSKVTPVKTDNRVNVSPNATLYVNNLPEKIAKQDLRRALYMLFSTYGPVLNIIALKTMKMRGQAHIVCRDTQASTQAMRALQGFEFFGKEIQVSYAKSKSDTIAKLDGTYKMPMQPTTSTVSTELQKSIFNAPPSAETPTANDPHSDIPKLTNGTSENGIPNGPQGLKRPREESDEGDAPMEEDDDGEAMEQSDED